MLTKLAKLFKIHDGFTSIILYKQIVTTVRQNQKAWIDLYTHHVFKCKAYGLMPHMCHSIECDKCGLMHIIWQHGNFFHTCFFATKI